MANLGIRAGRLPGREVAVIWNEREVLRLSKRRVNGVSIEVSDAVKVGSKRFSLVNREEIHLKNPEKRLSFPKDEDIFGIPEDRNGFPEVIFSVPEIRFGNLELSSSGPERRFSELDGRISVPEVRFAFLEGSFWIPEDRNGFPEITFSVPEIRFGDLDLSFPELDGRLPFPEVNSQVVRSCFHFLRSSFPFLRSGTTFLWRDFWFLNTGNGFLRACFCGCGCQSRRSSLLSLLSRLQFANRR